MNASIDAAQAVTADLFLYWQNIKRDPKLIAALQHSRGRTWAAKLINATLDTTSGRCLNSLRQTMVSALTLLDEECQQPTEANVIDHIERAGGMHRMHARWMDRQAARMNVLHKKR